MIKLFILLYCAKIVPGWNQQFGDPGSTNHMMINPNAKHLIKAGWNYTQVWNHGGLFYTLGAAMSESGVLFLPYLSNGLQVRAIAPNGTVLWVAGNIGSDGMCSGIYMTNTVYCREHNTVIVGWMCLYIRPLFENKGQFKSLNATDGGTVWQSPILPMSDASTISISSTTLYGSGGYDCGRNMPFAKISKTFRPSAFNRSSIFAIGLDDGKVLWTEEVNSTACKTQTKIGRLKDGHDLVLVPIDLPPGPYDTGSLLALKCDVTGSCAQAWLNKLRLSYYAQYAFSSDGVIFGSYGIAGNPDLIFGLDAETGDVLFSNRGYCVPGGYPSGPAVDEQGHAYYR